MGDGDENLLEVICGGGGRRGRRSKVAVTQGHEPSNDQIAMSQADLLLLFRRMS